jgi:AraC-like DNA-binding protein
MISSSASGFSATLPLTARSGLCPAGQSNWSSTSTKTQFEFMTRHNRIVANDSPGRLFRVLKVDALLLIPGSTLRSSARISRQVEHVLSSKCRSTNWLTNTLSWKRSGARRQLNSANAYALLLRLPHARFCLSEKALTAHLFYALERHYAVRFALDAFSPAESEVTVGRVAQRIGLSQRRFIQVFKQEVGMSPKLFCRVRRFQQVLELMRDESNAKTGHVSRRSAGILTNPTSSTTFGISRASLLRNTSDSGASASCKITCH